jgi:hypothetical protein
MPSSIRLVLLVSAHLGRIGVHLGTKVPQDDQRLSPAGVLVGYACFRTIFSNEVFVFGEFVEADDLRAVERLAVDLAGALHADKAIGTGVPDGRLHSGLHSEFFGGEQLFAVHLVFRVTLCAETEITLKAELVKEFP